MKYHKRIAEDIERLLNSPKGRSVLAGLIWGEIGLTEYSAERLFEDIQLKVFPKNIDIQIGDCSDVGKMFFGMTELEEL